MKRTTHNMQCNTHAHAMACHDHDITMTGRTTLDRSAARAIRSFRRLTMASMTRAASSLRFCFSISVRPAGRVLVSMMHSVPSLYPSGQMRGHRRRSGCGARR